jgi:hypothetical protein
MYKIIGADGKEYGPITAEQVRQWVAEGRANANTQARLDGATDWQPLSAFPEFAPMFEGGMARSSPSGVPPSFPSSDGREAAARAVKGPAIALIVTASLGIAYYLFSGVGTLIAGGSMFHRNLPPEIPPQLKAFVEGMQGPMAGVISLAIAAVNGFLLFGAIKMLRLQNRPMAMAAAIVAMVPCQCCCLLGLPFGIWALVVLAKPEVKSAFH